ncbi:hypothetical protein Bca4012_027464 [Brassica carinata]
MAEVRGYNGLDDFRLNWTQSSIIYMFKLGSTLTMASTKDIDSICNLVKNKTFCEQTLKAYPPAASATNIAKLVKATLDLGMNEAKKRAGFVAGLEKEPSFKKYFKMCNESYTSIVQNFRGARLEIEENQSETSILSSVVETLRGFVVINGGLSSFPEMFIPISTLLLHQVGNQEAK